MAGGRGGRPEGVARQRAGAASTAGSRGTPAFVARPAHTGTAGVACRRAWRGQRSGRRVTAAGDRRGRARRPRAGRRAGVGVRWLGHGAAGLGRGPLAGSAAPPIRVRHCRAKIGGAADPATSPVSALVVATLAFRRAIMHGAAQAFRRAMPIGAVKSVSFEKTNKQC